MVKKTQVGPRSMLSVMQGNILLESAHIFIVPSKVTSQSKFDLTPSMSSLIGPYVNHIQTFREVYAEYANTTASIKELTKFSTFFTKAGSFRARHLLHVIYPQDIHVYTTKIDVDHGP